MKIFRGCSFGAIDTQAVKVLARMGLPGSVVIQKAWVFRHCWFLIQRSEEASHWRTGRGGVK